MKKCLILTIFAFLLAVGPGWAQESIENGTYVLSDGKMTMTLQIQAAQGGKYFVNGDGQTKDGKTCRIGDLGELSGGKLMLGVCTLEIKISKGQLQIEDNQKCISCEPGAYVTGIYLLQ